MSSDSGISTGWLRIYAWALLVLQGVCLLFVYDSQIFLRKFQKIELQGEPFPVLTEWFVDCPLWFFSIPLWLAIASVAVSFSKRGRSSLGHWIIGTFILSTLILLFVIVVIYLPHMTGTKALSLSK